MKGGIVGNRQKAVSTEEDRNKAIQLFKYIRELNNLKTSTVVNISKYEWVSYIENIPADTDNIKLGNRDVVEENNQTNEPLLSVHKPDLQSCPKPDKILHGWLKSGWDDFRNEECETHAFLSIPLESVSIPREKLDPARIDTEKLTYLESFEEDEKRNLAFNNWIVKRNLWVETQNKLQITRNYFSELFNLFHDFERDDQTYELVIANGFLIDNNNSIIEHPLITQRLGISFDADSNTITLDELGDGLRLEVEILTELKEINATALQEIQIKLAQEVYSPLDKNELPLYLNFVAHSISDKSKYYPDKPDSRWNLDNRIAIYWKPCLIKRKRRSGVTQAIDRIIDHIENTKLISPAFLNMVTDHFVDQPIAFDIGTSIEQQLASAGGENLDIVLPKEANKEQLEIAYRIANSNAVVVQGPPGTGKTHTIANLIGHFLSEGKTVLVTSEKPKALKVLKEKLPEDLRSLCISVLGDNRDMEKSIRGLHRNIAKGQQFFKNEKERLANERRNVFNNLSLVRKQLYQAINKEAETIIINGESISPTNAAKFVKEHKNDYSEIIPGDIVEGRSLPLSEIELIELYKSNVEITEEEEKVLENNIVELKDIPSEADFKNLLYAVSEAESRLKRLSQRDLFKVTFIDDDLDRFEITARNKKIIFSLDKIKYLNNLRELVLKEKEYPADEWMLFCGSKSKEPNYREAWLTLIQKIKSTSAEYDNLYLKSIGRNIVINDKSESYINSLNEFVDYLKTNSKIKKFTGKFKKNIKIAKQGATINGEELKTVEDCELVFLCLELEKLRSDCALHWDGLIANHGGKKFKELNDGIEPSEKHAKKWIDEIEHWLNWYDSDYKTIIESLKKLGIEEGFALTRNTNDTDFNIIKTLHEGICSNIPNLLDLIEAACDFIKAKSAIEETKYKLTFDIGTDSLYCKDIVDAFISQDSEMYKKALDKYSKLIEKLPIYEKRKKYIERLGKVAPDWADFISLRYDKFGLDMPPKNISEAWLWRQYFAALKKITEIPYKELQEKSIRLSRKYRELTTAFATNSSWYKLLNNPEISGTLQRSLERWNQTMQKIGKGSGKLAAMHRAQARELMLDCQNAIPVWIMPMATALESLNPGINKFDVVIVDEASQSDISSLAILYLGQKLIIVGDDKQVSPSGVGKNLDKITSLQQTYLQDIKGYHLYDLTTSIYDIAKQTFKPVMLREHFRCVPEIIAFSNFLSYDGSIKPLRESSSSNLLPAVINYRVNGSRTSSKVQTNICEARSIAVLIKACLKHEEYRDKTFGVIVLLGTDQVTAIQREIQKYISESDQIKHKITVGTAADFQGDERDVIFLSLVDSPDEDGGPLRRVSNGPQDSEKKRYNVAVSRARDQLWVINSLDPEKDLKTGDIRQTLLKFARNPKEFLQNNENIEKLADSPFEASVAKALTSNGFHIYQQYPVGAYRIDIVVSFNNKKIAVECDGERYHSGSEKIAEDMERQTVLERLGWQFIRIRGSQYYQDPDGTIKQLIEDLNLFGIFPESTRNLTVNNDESDLKARVLASAQEIYPEIGEILPSISQSHILNEQVDIGGNISDIKEIINDSSTKTEDFPISSTSDLDKNVINLRNNDNFLSSIKVKDEDTTKNNKIEKTFASTRNNQNDITVYKNLKQNTHPAEPKTVSSNMKRPDTGAEVTETNKVTAGAHAVNTNISVNTTNNTYNEVMTRIEYPDRDRVDIKDVEEFIKSKGIKYIKKENKKSYSICIIGGFGLYDIIIKRLKSRFGIVFIYKEDGKSLSNYENAWFGTLRKHE